MDEDLHNEMSDPELSERADAALSSLFGMETVEMARLVDAADLNMNEQIVKSVSDGVARLKQLKGRQADQIRMLESMAPGERLLLCLWIRDMELLEKIADY